MNLKGTATVRPIGLAARTSPLVVAGISVLISGVAVWAAWSLSRHTSFQSSHWLAGDARERGEMARTLHSSSILVGRTREEVLSLLGRPDSSSAEEASALYYSVDVGVRWASAPWMYTFVVTFDPKTNRVASTDLRD
jgi:hypothetical protein